MLAVAGEPLRMLLKIPRKMLSSALMAMWAKRGASSMAGKGIEFSGERDFEESSKLKDAEVEASGSLELLGEVSGTRLDSIAVRTSERKRMRRADEESVCPAEKKSNGVVRLRSNEAGKLGTPSRDSGEPFVGEAFSAVRAASSAKKLLDQVCSFFVLTIHSG